MAVARRPAKHLMAMTDSELAFSQKYDARHARRYFDKHQRGFWRRLNTWRETGMARRALAIAGNPSSVLDLPCGTGRFWKLLAEKPQRKIYAADLDRKSTRLNSSHSQISYAVFCLK